jgi:DNA sulfur modification protein DndB
MARLARDLVNQVDAFTDMTEMAKSKISNRSLKLFTLSAIYHATKTLLSGSHGASYAERLATAASFWSEIAKQIPDWRRAKERAISSAELRKSYVHAHGIALAALGRVGKDLLANHPKDWKRWLRPLRALDWARSNSRLWQGRAMVAGRLSKTSVSAMLTANAIKRHLGIPRSPDEERVERQYRSKSER